MTINATDRPLDVGPSIIRTHYLSEIDRRDQGCARPSAPRKRISAEDAREFVEAISILPNQVPDPSGIAVATRDADDDYLVALAREHDAKWIVTGDDRISDTKR